MKKSITLNEDKTEVTVELSLTRRILARDPRMTFTTNMVKTMLENDNLKLDKCLLHDIIDNHKDNSKHDGKWIFSIAKELQAAKPLENNNKKSTKKKKSNKKQ
tara:strand:- start:549 stop:857 length:309 start_codon:yes stop_codon:yes gene_type:complete